MFQKQNLNYACLPDWWRKRIGTFSCKVPMFLQKSYYKYCNQDKKIEFSLLRKIKELWTFSAQVREFSNCWFSEKDGRSRRWEKSHTPPPPPAPWFYVFFCKALPIDATQKKVTV